ncbi:MAG TPA: hypothetical protein VHZ55_20115 [Bryobacteraceae bacterium]|nr:hypothetical protein [Bryobacteraceae bacterium]
MQPALLIRLRPAGPWRYGPGDGALDRTDTLYRSDRLYSALSLAMRQLGALDEWLDATARAPHPAATFSSLFPYQSETLFAVPPAVAWPPPPNQVRAPNSIFLAKIRWKTAHFVPLSVIESLITGGAVLADQWAPDPESGCLLRRDRPSSPPFRIVTRKSAAVDRLARMSAAESSSACVEFEPGAGLWSICRFADEAARDAWSPRIEGAFRLLADDGFGGRRSQGWGHSESPVFERGQWPNMIMPRLGARENNNGGSRFWLLSLYSPAGADQVDWNSGDYRLAVRGGRVESPNGAPVSKKTLRMVTEGSVLVARLEPNGAAVDVAPENFAHPVYRSGLALAVELPLTIAAIEEVASERQAVEEPGSEEAVIEAVVPRLEEVPDEPEVAPEAEHVPGEEPPAIESSESVAPEIETPEIETPETETPREDSGDAV